MKGVKEVLMKFTKDDTLAVKGIAIFMMVQHHCFRDVSVFKNYDISFAPFGQDIVVMISSFFKICVGMYVFLSAYGLTLSLKKYDKATVLSSDSYADYLNTRLIKLMWGFFFIFILAQVVNIFIDPERSKIYFQDGIVRGIFSFTADFFGLARLFGTPTLCNTWWYMTLAVFIVLIVPFVARITKKYNILFAVIIAFYIPRIIDFASKFNLGLENRMLRWLLAIVLGVIFAQYDVLAKMKAFMITNNRVISKIIKFILATAILIFLFYARDNYSKDKFVNVTYELNDSIIPAFVIYYCYEFIIGIPVIRTILVFFGKHSMNIFLLHSFIRHYWFEEEMYSLHNFALVTLAVFVITLALSVVIELIKKVTGYNKLMNVVINKVQNRFGRCNSESTAKHSV